jgi:glycosyltransferase involved in cell wall biosynthesis
MSNVERTRVLIITDAFFPSNSSVAILINDLAKGLENQGAQVTILIPNANQSEPLRIFNHEDCEIISVKALKTKDIGYVKRTIHEFLNPFLMWHVLKKAPHFLDRNYQGIIWYSPTIFWGPLVKRLKAQFRCPSYLVLRDIFPDWAKHLGLLGPGMKYWFFDAVARFQYRQANRIGVQSPNNLAYFEKNYSAFCSKAEVLWNWVSTVDRANDVSCSIQVSQTLLQGRTILVYAGNLGIAQGGMEPLFHLAKCLLNRNDVGILVVGRGSEISKLRNQISEECVSNLLVFDEINAVQIPALLKQCHIGLIFLDRRHQTHNIPGKLLAYIQSGLPTLSWINPNNDLENLVSEYGLGSVYRGTEIDEFANLANQLIDSLKDAHSPKGDYEKSLKDLFLPEIAARQILLSFKESA